jgi:DNA-binding response OmpR family regulator
MKTKARILIIEDDPNILIGLKDNLEFEGYQVRSATDGEQGLKMALSGQFDLVILDLMLPICDGLEVCRELRKKDEYTPVLMLTAKSDNIDKIIGYEIGADDYVTKPYHSRVLLAKIKALLRRMNPLPVSHPKEFRFGEFELSADKMVLQKGNQVIHLTPYEYGILHLLLSNPNKVIDRQTIMDKVWGEDIIVSSRTVDTHVAHVRQKIESNPQHPIFIKSVRSFGYRFDL